MISALIIGAAYLQAGSEGPDQATLDDVRMAQREAAIALIGRDCALPRGTLRLTQFGELRVQHDKNLTFEQMDCAFEQVERNDRLFKLARGLAENGERR